jgi:hypothetical protein
MMSELFKENDTTYHAVIQSIGYPQPKRSLGEEFVFLSKRIQLGVPIQKSCGNKLIKDADDKRRQNGEKNVIE